jgi:hypothetical protein
MVSALDIKRLIASRLPVEDAPRIGEMNFSLLCLIGRIGKGRDGPCRQRQR